MDIKEQVCTLQQARELHYKGVAQSSLYRWSDYGHEELMLVYEGQVLWSRNRALTVHPGNFYGEYAAFNVAELGSIMKDLGPYHVTSFYNTLRKQWNCTLWLLETFDEKGHPDGFVLSGEVYGRTEAECRTSMLLLLIERNILTIPVLNYHLKSA